MNVRDQANELGIYGILTRDEAQCLASLATDRDCLEIGSFKGLSAYCMATTAKSVFCVDPFTADPTGNRLTGKITTLYEFEESMRNHAPNVHWGVGTSREYATVLQNMTYDLIFIDADHSYESVKEDLASWWPHVNLLGILVCHDYGNETFPGVKRAFNDFFGKPEFQTGSLAWVVRSNGKVTRALDSSHGHWGKE